VLDVFQDMVCLYYLIKLFLYVINFLLFSFYLVFIYSPDIFSNEFWSAELLPEDPVINRLKENLKITVLSSRAKGTTDGYLRSFNRWKLFAQDVLMTNPFPVLPLNCALYLQHLLETTQSTSSINCAFYAIKWVHKLADLPSPTDHPVVIAVREGAIRLASRPPVHRKEPLHVLHLQQLADLTDFDDLLQFRNVLMFIISFSGFLRSAEVRQLRSRDVTFNEGYVSLTIESSKTDQLREGQSVVIAESAGSRTCPVQLLKYISKSSIIPNSDEFLFRPISSSNNKKRLVSTNKPISYSTYRDAFKKSFNSIVPDISNFSTHSNRSGGATMAINSGASDRNVQRHGRWRSATSKDRYVKDSLASRLDVSKSLAL